MHDRLGMAGILIEATSAQSNTWSLHWNPSQHMREAIIGRLEELEDYYVVKERTSKPYKTVPHEEVLRRLGLSDNADTD